MRFEKGESDIGNPQPAIGAAGTVAAGGRYILRRTPAAMLNLASRQRVQPRRFHYEPRFYDPKKEERLKRRLRIERTHQRPKSKQPHFVAVAVALVLAFLLYVNIDQIAERAFAIGGMFFGG